MPSAINGIGTWYYGKKNIFQRQDSCDHCGHHATLTSYDTTLYFIIFFIPLIPLGKKRVIDQCSACSRHRSLPLKQWEFARAQTMEEVQTRLRQSSSDAQMAHDFLDACMAFQTRDIFVQSARDIRRNHAGNIEVLKHLAGTYFNFAMWPEAEETSRATLKMDDTPDSREFLAYTLIKQGKPDDAAYYLSHLYNADQKDKVGYLFLLAEAFQAQGDHRKALQVFDQCAGVFPGMAQNKEFKKLRKISDKNRDSRKPIKHKELASGDVTIKSGSSVGSMMAFIIGPVILMGLLGLYLFLAYSKGQAREVYLANGLSTDYLVRVNGESYRIPAMNSMTIKIPEGEVTVEAAAPGLPIETQTAMISTPFWTRPFLNRTYVLNPDRTAPIVYEKIFYVPDDKDIEPPPGLREYHVGEFLYAFSGIDYEFQNFPDEIKMSSSSKAEAKDRVAMLRPDQMLGGNILLALLYNDEKERAIAVARRRIALEPETIEVLDFLARVTPPEEFIELLKPGLAVQPLRVNWHRYYQSMMEKAHPDHDLAAEYKALLDAEPHNAGLHYLYGRVLDDPEAIMAEYRLATQGPEPSAFGLGALAYHLVSQGEFAEAVQWAEQALDRDPENPVAQGTLRNALFGSENYDKLMAMIARDRPKSPRNPAWYVQEVIIQARQGRDDAVEDTIKRAVRAIMGRDWRGEDTSYIESILRTHAAYVKGDWDTYVTLTSNEEGELDFEAAISTGDTAQAVKIMDEMLEYDDEGDWHEFLLTYLALMRAGEAEKARKYFDEAVSELRNGDKAERTAAAWLAGEATPGERDLLAHSQNLKDKVLVLAALGMQRPELRPVSFALAKRLNVDPMFPWHFINSVVTTSPEGGP